MKNFYEANADKLFEQATSWRNHLKEIAVNKGLSVMVRKSYELIDNVLKNSGIWEKASCKKNCYFCCHDKILLTKPEANYIKSYITHERIKPDSRRLLKQKKTADFNKLKWADKGCIFLKDGSCSIYDVRPTVCRKHNSMEDPKYCHKGNYPNRTIVEGRIVESEAVGLAVLMIGAELEGVSPDRAIKPMHEYF